MLDVKEILCLSDLKLLDLSKDGICCCREIKYVKLFCCLRGETLKVRNEFLDLNKIPNWSL